MMHRPFGRWASGLVLLLVTTTVIQAADITWDGGGGDGQWTTAANWSTDTVPTNTDNVTFDGTSVADCSLPGNVEMLSLTVTASYTGTIETNGRRMTILGNLVLAGGTITENPDIDLGGDFSRTNGSASIDVLTLQKTSGPVVFQQGLAQPGLTIDDLTIASNAELTSFTETLNINNSLTIQTNAQFSTDSTLTCSTVYNSGQCTVNGLITVSTFYNYNLGVLVLAGGGSLNYLDNDENTSIDADMTINTLVNSQNFKVASGVTVLINTQFNNQSGGTIELGSVGQAAAIVDARPVSTFFNSSTFVIFASGSGVWHDAQEIGFVDASSNPLPSLAPGDPLYVLVRDLDENRDGTTPDTVTVTVTGLTNGDTENLVLTETSNTSGVFVSSPGALTELLVDSPQLLNGTLEFAVGENLRAAYSDPNQAGDSLSTDLQLPPVVWDNGGADDRWTTPENWSTDTVPTKYDRVRFDSTSTANCLIDPGTVEVVDFEIASGYTGTVSQTGRIRIWGDCVLDDGTLGSNPDLEIHGEFLRSGGVLDMDLLELRGSGVDTTTLGPAANLDIARVRVFAGAKLTLNSENLLLTSTLQIDGEFFIDGDLQCTTFTNYSPEAVEVRGNHTITNFYHYTTSSTGTVLFSGTTTITNYFDVWQTTSGEVRIDGFLTTPQLRNRHKLRILADSTLQVTSSFTQGATAATELILDNNAQFDAETATTWNTTSGKLTEGTGIIRRFARDLGFVDAGGQPVDAVAVGSDAVHITCSEDDGNIDDAAIDTIQVTVQSPTTGDSEVITLTETANSSGVFDNLAAPLTTLNATASIGDNTLQMAPGENLQVSYQDPGHPADNLTVDLVGVPIVWDGGGSDENWTTPENWTGDAVPTQFDRVVFNATSVKDCTIDQNVSVLRWEVEGTYTGTISSSGRKLTAYGSIIQSGGTVSGTLDIDLHAQLTRTGGSMALDSLNVYTQGVPFSTLGPSMTLGDLILHEGSSIDLIEPVTVSDQFSLQGGDANIGNPDFPGGLSCDDLITASDSSFSILGPVSGRYLQHSGTGTMDIDGTVDMTNYIWINSNAGLATFSGDIDTPIIYNYNQITVTNAATVTITSQLIQNTGTSPVLTLESNVVLDATAATNLTVTRGIVVQTGGGRILYPSTGLGFLDGGGSPAVGYVPGVDSIFATITDEDENIDAGATDTLQVTVESLTTGDSETITLTETTNTSEVFNNLGGGLATEDSATANIGDGTLQFVGGEDLRVSYTDAQDAADQQQVNLLKPPLVWDNDSGDGLWTTAANWSTDTVPTTFDSVRFDGTSGANCTVNASGTVTLIDFVVDSAYTGTVLASNRNFHITRDMTLGGNATGFSTIDLDNDFQRTGGTFQASQLHLNKAGVALTSFGPAGGVTLAYLRVEAGGSLNLAEDLTLSHDLTCNGPFTISGAFSCRNLSITTGITAQFDGPTAGFSAITVNGTGVCNLNAVGTVSNWIYLPNNTAQFNVGADLTVESINWNAGLIRVLSGNTMTVNSSFYQYINPAAQLVVETGAVADLRTVGVFNHGAGTLIQNGTGRIRRNAVELGFIDDAGQPTVSYVSGSEDVQVQIRDDDENVSSTVADTISLTVTNLANGDVENLTVTETTATSGQFDSLGAGLPTATTAGSSGDGTLQYLPGDNLRVSYQDPEDPDDSLSSELLEPFVLWDGGGVDSNWTTAENWSNDEVPDNFTRVRFDDTSAKVCVVNTHVQVREMLVASSFASTFNGNTRQITVYGPLTIEGGTITGSPTFFLHDDFSRTGGVASIGTLEFFKTTGAPLSSLGGPGLTLGNLTLRAGVDVTLNEDVDLSSYLTIEGSLVLNGDLDANRLNTNGAGQVSLNGGSYTLTNNLNHAGTGTCTVSGNLTVASSLNMNSTTAGLGTFSGTITTNNLNNYSQLTITGGTTLTVTNSYWQGGIAGALLTIQDGGILDCNSASSVTFQLGTLDQQGSGRVLRPASNFVFTNAAGTPVTSLAAGEDDVYLTLTDEDENEDAASIETVSVVIRSPVTGDLINETLTETSANSGVFNNLGSGVPTAVAAAAADSTLQLLDGENIVADYTDDEDPTDVLSVLLDEGSAVSVTMSSSEGSPTSANPVPVTVTFGAPVTGFVVGDLVFVNGSATGFSGSGANYSFGLVPDGDGLMQVTIPAGVASDGTNPNSQALFTRVSDTTVPTVTISPNSGTFSEADIDFTFTFSETVSGFTQSDLIVTNGSVTAFGGIGASFSATVQATAPGTVTVQVPGASCIDVASNPVSGNSASVTYDPGNALGIPQQQYDALVAIYNATNGSTTWTTTIGWLDSGAATWFGVTVSGGQVTELDLENNGLSGNLPLELGDLPALTILDVSDNNLSGLMSGGVVNLTLLEFLDLRDNQLNGEFPDLTGLDALTALFMDRNGFAGSAPDWIPDLPSIYGVGISGNQFTGPVPGNWSSLSVASLDISYNALTASGAVATNLDSLQPGWETTQTVAPSGLAVQTADPLVLQWSAIAYAGSGGGYQIGFRPTGSLSAYTELAGNLTADKDVTSLQVLGLSPSTDYDFVIKTITDPHAGNPFQLESPWSPVLNASTPGTGDIQLDAISATVDEGAGSISVNLQRVGGSSGPASADWTLSQDTATADVDYEDNFGTASWADGETADKTIVININDDVEIEGDETFTIEILSTLGAGTGSPTTSTVTITDNDGGPGQIRWSLAGTSVGEGAGTATLTVQRVGGTEGPASVQWSTGTGSATAGSDYTAVSSTTLNWADGNGDDQQVVVTILDDGSLEGSETFTALLSGVTGATLGSPSSQTVTIVDDEVPPVEVALVAGSALLYEGQQVSASLSLFGAAPSPITVDFAVGGDLTSGDFTSLSMTIPTGADSASFTIQATDDSVAEFIKSGSISIYDVSGGGFLSEGTDNYSIELRDDDADPAPLQLYAPSYPTAPRAAKVGESVQVYAFGGTPPFSYTASGAAFLAGNLKTGVYDFNSDGVVDKGQGITLVPLRTGSCRLTVTDSLGASVDLLFVPTALPVRKVPAPTIPASEGDETIFAPLAGASPQGLEALLEAVSDNDTRYVKAGAWDAITQKFVQLPTEPTGGLLPSHGIFLASRIDLGLDVSGNAVPIPYDLPLQPGWNFLGIPALDGVAGIDWGNLELYDEGGIQVAVGDVADLIGTKAYLWDGDSYGEVTTLLAGKAYWIFNSSTDPAQTLTLRIPVGGGFSKSVPLSADAAKLGSSSGHRHGKVSDDPPDPGGSRGKDTKDRAAADSGGGGCGSGLGMVVGVLVLLGFVSLWRQGRREDDAEDRAA